MRITECDVNDCRDAYADCLKLKKLLAAFDHPDFMVVVERDA